jgi:hypothetical protein
MDATRRRLGLPAVLSVVVIALAAAVLWATSALAAGDSASNERSSDENPAAAYVQSEGDPDRNCPNREGESGASSDV